MNDPALGAEIEHIAELPGFRQKRTRDIVQDTALNLVRYCPSGIDDDKDVLSARSTINRVALLIYRERLELAVRYPD